MPEELVRFGTAFWEVLAEMAPYLLFGFLIAGFLAVLIPRSAVENHLGRKGILSILKATVFGVPLPLCSCGVIPVTAGLRRHGASKGAATAFLLSTPQTGVDSILVTASLLGPVFTAFKIVVSVLAGVVGGLAVDAAGGRGPAAEGEASCSEACCTGHGKHGKTTGAVRYAFITLVDDIGPALLLGLLVCGAISALIPDGAFAGLLRGGILAMIVMLVAGIPVYVCATASVPIAAALLTKGVSPGAVLVFLMTGPATNAAALAALWKMMGRRSALIYLSTVAVAAMASGLVLDLVLAEPAVASVGEGAGEILPPLVGHVSAVVLLGLIGVSVGRRVLKAGILKPRTSGVKQVLLAVGGMRCNVCGAMVEKALLESRGVDSVDVDVGQGSALIRGNGLDIPDLQAKVKTAGFASGEGPDGGAPGHDEHRVEGGSDHGVESTGLPESGRKDEGDHRGGGGETDETAGGVRPPS
ncbi:MAG: SO_0444 family Cu/Zn efflux transporter [Planctomycetota bacterium]|jgi:uncharacterized membrane protein YraQ (UPF0718 family)/copper chaperone CopZ